jgi:hypothetical protein
MARIKQTARKSTGGKVGRRRLALGDGRQSGRPPPPSQADHQAALLTSTVLPAGTVHAEEDGATRVVLAGLGSKNKAKKARFQCGVPSRWGRHYMEVTVLTNQQQGAGEAHPRRKAKAEFEIAVQMMGRHSMEDLIIKHPQLAMADGLPTYGGYHKPQKSKTAADQHDHWRLWQMHCDYGMGVPHLQVWNGDVYGDIRTNWHGKEAGFFEGDVVGLVLDQDNDSMEIYKNGDLIGINDGVSALVHSNPATTKHLIHVMHSLTGLYMSAANKDSWYWSFQEELVWNVTPPAGSGASIAISFPAAVPPRAERTPTPKTAKDGAAAGYNCLPPPAFKTTGTLPVAKAASAMDGAARGSAAAHSAAATHGMQSAAKKTTGDDKYGWLKEYLGCSASKARKYARLLRDSDYDGPYDQPSAEYRLFYFDELIREAFSRGASTAACELGNVRGQAKTEENDKRRVEREKEGSRKASAGQESAAVQVEVAKDPSLPVTACRGRAQERSELAPPAKKARVLCSFYSAGFCSAGSSCRFSHDNATSSLPPCRFWNGQGGSCHFGDGCRFRHDANPTVAATETRTIKLPPGVTAGAIIGHAGATIRRLRGQWPTVRFHVEKHSRHNVEVILQGQEPALGKAVIRLENLIEDTENANMFGGGGPASVAGLVGGLRAFSGSDTLELLCQGVKPWDDDAHDVLAVLNGY